MTNRKILNEVTHDTSIKGRWADHLYDLMPVQQKSDGMYYFRDDLFAPLGINSINGSKLRQLIFLFDREDPSKVDTVVSGTNVNKSPQSIMGAAVAQHYGYRCINVAGGSNWNSINKKELPLAATLFGAEYDIQCRSGFNVNIQKRADEIMADLPRAFKIERDITVDQSLEHNTAEVLAEFHKIGGHQVRNVPDHIEDLIIPFGSANSATSIMLGLAMTPPMNLKRIHLVNVGQDKRDWMWERLEMMGAKEDLEDYEFVWHDTHVKYDTLIKDIKVDDITFHYRYESKAYKYLLDNRPDLINEKSLFWIIGSVPDTATTAANLGREVPKEVTLYDGI